MIEPPYSVQHAGNRLTSARYLMVLQSKWLDTFTKIYQSCSIHIPAKMDIMLHASNRQYLDAFGAVSPDKMRLWVVLRVLMVPSCAPSRIHLNGKKHLCLSPLKELARSPGVCTKLVEVLLW